MLICLIEECKCRITCSLTACHFYAYSLTLCMKKHVCDGCRGCRVRMVKMEASIPPFSAPPPAITTSKNHQAETIHPTRMRTNATTPSHAGNWNSR